MGVLSLVKLVVKLVKGGNLIAFLAAIFFGYVIATLLPAGPWSIYIFLMVSFHIFLAWLVLNAYHEEGFSQPIPMAILIHVGFLAIMIAFGYIYQDASVLKIVRFSVASLAIYERKLLFRRKTQAAEEPVANAPVSDVILSATAEDHEAWLRHLAHRGSSSRKPGATLKDEYEQFIAQRIKNRPAPASISGDPAV